VAIAGLFRSIFPGLLSPLFPREILPTGGDLRWPWRQHLPPPSTLPGLFFVPFPFGGPALSRSWAPGPLQTGAPIPVYAQRTVIDLSFSWQASQRAACAKSNVLYVFFPPTFCPLPFSDRGPFCLLSPSTLIPASLPLTSFPFWATWESGLPSVTSTDVRRHDPWLACSAGLSPSAAKAEFRVGLAFQFFPFAEVPPFPRSFLRSPDFVRSLVFFRVPGKTWEWRLFSRSFGFSFSPFFSLAVTLTLPP